MVDNLLDLLTGGEHRKTKKIIDEKRKFREEEEKIKQLMESKPAVNSANNGNVKVELSQLKTLSDLGIDTSFLNSFGKALLIKLMSQRTLVTRLDYFMRYHHYTGSLS